MTLNQGWHQGPLPAGTYGWGAVVKVGHDPLSGFEFAGFNGDHANDLNGNKIEAAEVAYYNNSLTLAMGPVR